MTAALGGMQSATQRFDAAGSRIASGDSDLAADVVELSMSKVQMSAAVAVSRSADQMMGTLLDMVG